jgi:hypothetical protein
MKPCFFEEPVEELLIFSPQTSPKLPPFLDFLFQNLTKRKDRSTHYQHPVSVIRVRLKEIKSQNNK